MKKTLYVPDGRAELIDELERMLGPDESMSQIFLAAVEAEIVRRTDGREALARVRRVDELIEEAREIRRMLLEK